MERSCQAYRNMKSKKLPTGTRLDDLDDGENKWCYYAHLKWLDNFSEERPGYFVINNFFVIRVWPFN